MKRSEFLKRAAMMPLIGNWEGSSSNSWSLKDTMSYGINGNRIFYIGQSFQATCNVLFLSDTHLWHSDEREDPYRQYSNRMAKG